jgi:hypothetical protein
MNQTPLTDQQIGATMFELPPLGLTLAFGPNIANALIKTRQVAESDGSELHFYGWPDGTTISWERTEPHLPLDIDGTVRCYHRFQETVRPLMEAQHESN